MQVLDVGGRHVGQRLGRHTAITMTSPPSEGGSKRLCNGAWWPASLRERSFSQSGTRPAARSRGRGRRPGRRRAGRARSPCPRWRRIRQSSIPDASASVARTPHPRRGPATRPAAGTGSRTSSFPSSAARTEENDVRVPPELLPHLPAPVRLGSPRDAKNRRKAQRNGDDRKRDTNASNNYPLRIPTKLQPPTHTAIPKIRATNARILIRMCQHPGR